MKRFVALLLAALMLLSTAACSQVGEINFEDLEIFKSLKNSINVEDSLEKIVDTFAEICKPLLSSEDNRYLFEADAYEENDSHYLKLVLAAEFKVPVYTETLRLDLVLIYKTDEDMSVWEESEWIDGDFDTYIDHVKSSNVFIKLIGKTVESHDLKIGKA